MSVKNFLEKIKGETIFLLSEIEVSNEDYDTLINYAKNRINTIDSTIPASDDILLALTLVQIAVREYAEGNYWRYFRKILDVPELPQYKQTYIGKSFLKTLEKYEMFIIDQSENGNAKYIENIKAHAFVPNNYLNGYYDFLYSFYEGNLLRSIPEDLSEDLLPMQNFMMSSLSSSDDSIKLENSGYKKTKTYRLLKASRIVFANMDTYALSNIMLKHLQILDQFYYDNVLPNDTDRFSKGFLNWTKDFENELEDKKIRKFTRKRGPVSHKPYFRFVNDKYFLIIPPQKFREEEIEEEVYLYVNGSKVKKLDIYNNWGIKISEEEKIEVDDIFSSFEIIIDSKKSKRYEIPKRVYRIFNETWEELITPKHDVNYFVYKKGVSIKPNKEGIISYPFAEFDEWNICQIDFDDDTVVYIDELPLTIKKVFTGKTDLEQYVTNRYYIEDGCGNRIHTVYRHIVISFIIKKSNLDRAILHCNDEQFSNIDIPGTTTFFDIENDETSIGVEMDLNNILISKDGVYKIWVDEPQNKRLIIEYLLISNLWCSPKSSRYFLRDYAKILTNGNYDLTPENCTVYEEENTYSLNLHNHKEAIFYINVDGVKYTVKVPVRVVEFNFKDEWIWSKPQYVWIDDFSNDLYIKLPGAIKCKVYLNDSYEDSVMGIFKNGVFEFNVTDIRNEILSSPKKRHSLHIVYEDTKSHDEELFVVLKSLSFKKIEYQNINGEFCIIVDYIGNANCYFDIYSKDGKCVANHKLIQNGINIIPELDVKELYDIDSHITQPDEFGFDEIELESPYRMKNQGIISTYENCSIRITFVKNNYKKLEFNRTYTIKKIKKYNDSSYTGVLYEKQNGGRFIEHILFPKVLFKFIEGKNNQLLLYVEEDGDWIEPIYDKLNKKLITEDMITTKNFDRYLPLFENETIYKYKIWRNE